MMDGFGKKNSIILNTTTNQKIINRSGAPLNLKSMALNQQECYGTAKLARKHFL